MSNKIYKIGIWGQFGSGEQIADGQAVRTTVITKEITERYGRENIKILNTNNWSKKPISFFLKSILLIVNCKKVIIFPANNGFKAIVPIHSFINKFFKRELYYVIIGGFLPALLNKNKKYIKLLNKYKALFAQTNNLKKDLENLGLSNVHILTNLKRLKKLNKSDIKVNNERKLSICTFSRVTETKGIEDAIKGVKIANEKLGGDYFNLDIYGIIDKKFEQRFQEILDRNSHFVSYKGVVDYDKTVDTLRNYFTLLFPTYYPGEGLPGNVIDAYYSGLPIIATDWLYNKDVIENNKNGLLIPINDPIAISDALMLFYKDRDLVFRIGLNNLRESNKYNPKEVLKDLFKFLD